MTKLSNHTSLGYYGLIPFLGLVGLNLVFENNVLAQAFLLYSVSIMSFVAGSLWKADNSDKANWLIVLPTIPTLVLSLIDTRAALLYLAASFIFVLLIQKNSEQWSTLSADYQRMRERVTAVVFVCHLFFTAQLHHAVQ